MFPRYASKIPVLIYAAHVIFALYLHFAYGISINKDSSLQWDWMWQNVPLYLLQNKPFESIWNLHSVPPIPNIVMAFLVRASALPVDLLHLVHILLGGLIPSCIFLILQNLKLNLFVSLGVSLIVVFDPSLVLYEAFLLYDIPTTLIFVLSTYLISVYSRTDNIKYLVFMIMILVVGSLTRSAIHYLFIGIVIIGCCIIAQNHRKQFLVMAVILCIPLGVWIGKNYYKFGVFGTSSWMGASLWKTVCPADSGAKNPVIQRLIAKKRIPEFLIQMDPFPFPNVFGKYGFTTTSSIEALSLNNQNNIGVVKVSKVSQEAALAVIKDDPMSYLSVVYDQYLQFCRPTGQSRLVRENASAIAPYNDFYIKWISGTVMWKGIDITLYKERWRVSWYFWAFPLILVLNTLRVAIKLKRANFVSIFKVNSVSMYISFLVAYVIVSSCFIEGSEGDRYKLYIEHLFWILLVVCLSPLQWRKVPQPVESDPR